MEQATPFELLTVGDISRMTGRSVEGIRLLERRGVLRPSFRLTNGVRLFSRHEVEIFIAQDNQTKRLRRAVA